MDRDAPLPRLKVMATRIRASLLTIAAMATCALSGCHADPFADAVNSEDSRIMQAMVAISCKLGVERIVISDLPAAPGEGGQRVTGRPNMHFGLDVSRRIARQARWPVGAVCPSVQVTADSNIENVLEHDTPSWDKFKAAFGGAHSLMRISLPVYSRDGTRAVVYTTGTCPYTCGAGFYHLLEKSFSGWRIANSEIAWKS
jgi:hypothetical protein